MTPLSRFSDRRMLDRALVRHVPRFWCETSEAGVVVTAHYLATAAGVEVLERGGNAIDAAVAASLALGVCEPAGSGLGGMAAALVHLSAPGRTFGVEGSCLAPESATPEEVSRSKRYRGYRAVAVPRYLAAIRHVLEGYGTLRHDEVLAPAIAIAEEGYSLTRTHREVTREYRRPLARSTAAPFFLDENQQPRPVGTRMRQPELARTLRRLQESGLEDFYLGGLAAEIVEDVELNEGFLGAADMERALEVSEVEPLSGAFDGAEVASLGPPFGGVALLQMLHMAESFAPEELDLRTPEGVVRVAALIRRARVDRKRHRLRTGAREVGDALTLLQPDYAERAAREAAGALHFVGGDGETTHISVLDRRGNAVSLTQSIERSFGAAVATPALGFLYNGYLRAFKVKNRRHPHYLRPGAPARSNAAPTLLLDENGVRVAVGSTGAERMTSGIFEVLLRLRKESPFEAVHGPRLHCTPEREVLWEEARFPRGCGEALARNGFTTKPLAPYSFNVGALALALRLADGRALGVAEPRRDGAAGGASPGS